MYSLFLVQSLLLFLRLPHHPPYYRSVSPLYRELGSLPQRVLQQVFHTLFFLILRIYSHSESLSRLSSFNIGRAVILRRLTPKVERLCKAAEAAGDKRPVNPIPINIPLKPIMNR